jgi:hypothetical protein
VTSSVAWGGGPAYAWRAILDLFSPSPCYIFSFCVKNFRLFSWWNCSLLPNLSFSCYAANLGWPQLMSCAAQIKLPGHTYYQHCGTVTIFYGFGSYVRKFTVMVPVPVPAPYLDHKMQIYQEKCWNLFYKEKVYKFFS